MLNNTIFEIKYRNKQQINRIIYKFFFLRIKEKNKFTYF